MKFLVMLLFSFVALFKRTQCMMEEVTFKINEEVEKNKLVGNVDRSLRLEYADNNPYFFGMAVKNKEITYLFRIDSKTSEIRTTNITLDRDTLCQKHSLCCRANKECKISFKVFYSYDKNLKSDLKFCKVHIIVEDINDSSPKFNVSHITVDVPESSKIGTLFQLPKAIDKDSSKFGVSSYRIEGTQGIFVARTQRLSDGSILPKLELNDRLDRETTKKYTMKLIAIDGGSPAKSGSVNVIVRVIDANDNAPEVDPTPAISINEDIPIGSIIGRVKARDPDYGENARLKYFITDSASSKIRPLFAIDHNNGEIRLKSRLDYDDGPTPSYVIPVIVKDGGRPSKSTTTSIVIHVRDVNDESPSITVVDLQSRIPPRPEIKENMQPDQFVAFVTVRDLDSGPNGDVSCQVEHINFRLTEVGGNPETRETEYNLVTARTLDREVSSKERVTIQCHDKGSPRRSSEAAVVVKVLDENDNAPRFASNTLVLSVRENENPGYSPGVLNASDADILPSDRHYSRGIHYSIDDEGKKFFQIDRNNGRLYTQVKLDREKVSVIRFKVTAKDSGVPPLTSIADVRVNVLDENDFVPLFDREIFRFSVKEDCPINYLVGIIDAKDLDEGINGDITYHLVDVKGLAQSTFMLNPRTGKLTTKINLDRERISEYEFQVMAADQGSPRRSSSARVHVEVTDINDKKPKFVYPTQLNHTVYSSIYNLQGTAIVKLTAVDNDIGENGAIVFYITGGNDRGIFQLDPKSGDITLTRDLTDADMGEYKLELEVKDNGSPSQFSKSLITVVFDTTSPRLGVAGYDRNGDPLGPRRHGGYFGDFGSDKNLVLVICLVITATVLAIIFMFIIIYLRRKPLLGSAAGHWRDGRAGGRGGQTGPTKKEIHLISIPGGGRGGGTLSSKPYPSNKDAYGTLKFGTTGTLNERNGDDGDDRCTPLSLACRGSFDSVKCGSHDHLNTGGCGQKDFPGEMAGIPPGTLVQEANGNYYHQIGFGDDYAPGSLFTYGDLQRETLRRNMSRSGQLESADGRRSQRPDADSHAYQTLQSVPYDHRYQSYNLPQSKLNKSSELDESSTPVEGEENRRLLLNDGKKGSSCVTSAAGITTTLPQMSDGDRSLRTTFNYTFLPIKEGSSAVGGQGNIPSGTLINSKTSARKPYSVVASSFV